MPRVLFGIDSFAVGGAERQLTLLVKSLPSDWEPIVWAMGGGPFEDLLRAAGISVFVHTRTRQYDVRPVLGLWKVLAQCRPHVYHSWHWMSSCAGGPACKLLGIPFVDGTIRMGQRPPQRAFTQGLGMRWADYVIANSQAGLAAWGIGSKRGRVVYNGFDPARLPAVGADAWAPGQPFTVVMVGRMHPMKDFQSFFAAARHLVQNEGRDWRFLAIGTGAGRATLISEAQDLVDAGVLEFPEAGVEVLPYVLKAHAGVLMTNPEQGAEGISNAIMEYMACGLPVVCSEGGGNRELVLDGQTGFIIPPHDVVTLAARIAYLRRETAEARSMGVAGRERICSAFSVESMVAETIKVYAEAMKPLSGKKTSYRSATH